MNARERSVFYSQFQRLLEAGVPIRSGLEMLSRHGGAAYSAAARSMLAAVDAGKSLTAGLRESGRKLPELHLRLLEVGERSGRMPAVLGQLREWDAEQNKLLHALITPLVYPCVLLLAAIGISPLPLLVSDGTGAYLEQVLPPLALVLGVPLALLALRAAAPGALRAMLDRVPGLAGVRRQMAGGAFLYALGTALESGLGLPESLEAAASSTEPGPLRDHGERCRAAAESGRFELEDLVDRRHFGPFASQVLLAAAETGTLGAAAMGSARLLREEALASARALIGAVAALVYLIAAFVVAMTVIGFYTKLYSTTSL